MEPEQSPQSQQIPEPINVPGDIQPTEAGQVVPPSAEIPQVMKKRSRLKDLLVSLGVIVVAGGAGWVLANHNSGSSDNTTPTPTATDTATAAATDTATPTASASPTTSPTPDYTTLDTSLKTLDTDLSTVDTSTSAAASAPADTDTTP